MFSSLIFETLKCTPIEIQLAPFLLSFSPLHIYSQTLLHWIGGCPKQAPNVLICTWPNRAYKARVQPNLGWIWTWFWYLFNIGIVFGWALYVNKMGLGICISKSHITSPSGMIYLTVAGSEFTWASHLGLQVNLGLGQTALQVGVPNLWPGMVTCSPKGMPIAVWIKWARHFKISSSLPVTPSSCEACRYAAMTIRSYLGWTIA